MVDAIHRSNQISDVRPLASLTKLTELDLDGNQISDVSCLASLTELTELYIRSNQIRYVSPLVSLTNLTRLDLSNNPLSKESIDIHVPALKTRGVQVTL